MMQLMNFLIKMCTFQSILTKWNCAITDIVALEFRPEKIAIETHLQSNVNEEISDRFTKTVRTMQIVFLCIFYFHKYAQVVRRAYRPNICKWAM